MIRKFFATQNFQVQKYQPFKNFFLNSCSGWRENRIFGSPSYFLLPFSPVYGNLPITECPIQAPGLRLLNALHHFSPFHSTGSPVAPQCLPLPKFKARSPFLSISPSPGSSQKWSNVRLSCASLQTTLCETPSSSTCELLNIITRTLPPPSSQDLLSISALA